MDLNKAQVIGRLTRDPELRTTPSGVNVCTMSVATSFVYTNQQTGQKVETPEYHNVVLWRKLADIAAQYLKKGRRVYVEGRLQTRSWDGQDGSKKYRTEIIADNMIMLDSGTGSGASSPASSPATASPFATSAQDSQAGLAPTEELPTIQEDEEIKVEDIPF